MFDIGPMDLMVLAVVGILVFGPDRLPGIARDAVRMIRTLRQLLLGTRSQLRDELGPELAALTGSDGLGRALGGDADLRKALLRLLTEEAPEAPDAQQAEEEQGEGEQGGAPASASPAARATVDLANQPAA